MVDLTPDQVKGRNMALSLGVEVYLYADADGKSVFSAIRPHPNAAALTLVETFPAPPASTPTTFAEKPGIALA